MPRRTLLVVAALIFVCAAGGFAMGLRSAANQPQLPAEASAPGDGGGVADALPVLRRPRAEPEPEPEATEEDEAEDAAEEPDEAPPPTPAPIVPPPAKLAPPPAQPSPPPEDDRVGDLLDGLSPNDLPPF